MDSIFGQQDFRDAYCVRPESRKDMPSVTKHCQPWKRKYSHHSPNSVESPYPLTAHTALLRGKPLCCTNFDTQFPLFLLLCVCFFYLIGRVPWLGEFREDHFFSGLSHSLQYGEWLTNKIGIISWLNSSTSLQKQCSALKAGLQRFL